MIWKLFAGLVCCVWLAAGAAGVENLPAEFYRRPGLEKMPVRNFAAMRQVSVLDFGADSTGKESVNGAFDRALEELTRQGGGVLYVPAGIYRFEGPTLTPQGRYSWRKTGLKNIHIVGDGAERSIIFVRFDAVRNQNKLAGYLWNFTKCEDLTLRDLGFSQFPRFGMRSPGWCEGIFATAFSDSTGVQVLRVKCDQGRMGICFWAGNRQGWVVDCEVRNTGADAIKFDDCEDMTAAYNYIENSNDDSFSALVMKRTSVNNRFLNNTLVYNQGWGRGIAISGRNHLVQGNWIESQAMAAIMFHDVGFKGSRPEAAQQNTGHVVADNRIIRGDLHGIRGNRLGGHRYWGAISLNYPFRDITIRDNFIAGSGSDGIGSPSSTRVAIDGVRIVNNRSFGNLNCGISLRADREPAFIRNLQLSGNVIAGNDAGSVRFAGSVEGTGSGNRADTEPVAGVPGVTVGPVAEEYHDIYGEIRREPDWKEWGSAPDFPVAGREWSVRDFGAVGDGVADDGPAFRRALAALPAEGGVLKIPAGRYRIEPAPDMDRIPFSVIRHHLLLERRRNVHLVGEPGRSVLVFTSPEHEGLRLIELQDSSIRGVSFEQTAKSPLRKNRALLDVVACRSFIAEHIAGARSTGHGLRFDNCSSVRIENCTVTDAGQNGIMLAGMRRTFLRNNRIANSRDHAIFVGSIGGVARLPQFVAIEGNRIEGTREGSGIAVPYGDQIRVSGNRISDTYMAGVGIFYVNAIFPPERIRIAENELSNCAFGELNYLPGAVSVFYVTAAKRRSRGKLEVEIEGNRIRKSAANGVWISSCSGVGRVVVKGNRFEAISGENVSIAPEQRAEIGELILE
ncbi:right-handed parallel beta-helix repeat-containing protein [uncultured Victivallis sp.]|uniref:right-handed parallel beta-helix repeat-containing protein n=1 Tax=uncultured Victivallis sp. TaxID=354118 RepID=UPI0025FD2F70|nr:right-handed parallel beta-helix repeat-containing protein [uncultured Victivallis sp.]